MPVMYIVLVCCRIVTISVLCTVIEIKTEVELICLAVCLGLSLEDFVLEQPIFKSAHNKKTTEGFFSRTVLHGAGVRHGLTKLKFGLRGRIDLKFGHADAASGIGHLNPMSGEYKEQKTKG